MALARNNCLFFIIRLDDIHPQMNLRNFTRMIGCLKKFNVTGILGVIPDNQDISLNRDKIDNNFWQRIKILERSGFAIAQHGYQHLYDTLEGGMLNINFQSEFAGHPYDIQKNKMEAGKKILEKKGLSPTLFMAPSHSFDQITLTVAKELNYAITDGFGFWPKIKREVLFIPQLFASPMHLGVGVYTICLHTDNMNDNDFDKIEKHLNKNHKKYILPNQLSKYTLRKNQYLVRLLDFLMGNIIKYILRLKRKYSV